MPKFTELQDLPITIVIDVLSRAAGGHGRSIDGTISQAAGMQSWIRDLIDLKTQISVLQNCMQQPASSHAAPASHYRVADNVNRGRRPHRVNYRVN